MRRLRGDGVTFMFISHYNEEILEICDCVSVLRDGALVTDNHPIVGHFERLERDGAWARLQLFTRGVGGSEADKPRRLAFSGLRGSHFSVDRLDIAKRSGRGLRRPAGGRRAGGRARHLWAIPAEGTVEHEAGPAATGRYGRRFGGTYRFPLRGSAQGRRRRDPFDRKNITLSSLGRYLWRSLFLWRANATWSRPSSNAFRSRRGIPTACWPAQRRQSAEGPAFSAAATEPRLLILNEPTRGIDVGVKEEVHRIVDA